MISTLIYKGYLIQQSMYFGYDIVSVNDCDEPMSHAKTVDECKIYIDERNS